MIESLSDLLGKISSKHHKSPTVRARELKKKEEKKIKPHNMSYVTCHMSHVMCHMSNYFYKVVKLIGWGSVINIGICLLRNVTGKNLADFNYIFFKGVEFKPFLCSTKISNRRLENNKEGSLNT